MGIDKIINGSKDYVTGYSDGFAAGISAGLAATSDVTAVRTETNPAETVPALKPINSGRLYKTHASPGGDYSSAVDLDLELLRSPGPTAAKMAETAQTCDLREAPASISPDELAHVAPGCFVQVGHGDSAYWVEIGQIDGSMMSGTVHPELSGDLCIIHHDSCEIARFRREQITALGCERYCWC